MGELSCNTINTTTSSTSNTTTITTTIYRVCVAYQDCLKSNRHESSEPSENEAAFGKRSIRASRTQVQIQPFDACVDGSVSNLVNRCTFQLRQLPGRRSSSLSHQTVSRTSRLCSVCKPSIHLMCGQVVSSRIWFSIRRVSFKAAIAAARQKNYFVLSELPLPRRHTPLQSHQRRLLAKKKGISFFLNKARRRKRNRMSWCFLQPAQLLLRKYRPHCTFILMLLKILQLPR